MFNYDAPNKLGTELSPTEQAHVLSAFCHRFTKEHKPHWAKQKMPNGNVYPVQFASDKEWLARTRFNVTAKGKLDRRHTSCHSVPTWPDNPELQGAHYNNKTLAA